MKNQTFRFGEWLVNPDTNSVENAAEKRQMEPRAMDVLVVLCQHGGAIVNAEALLEQCWGSTVYGDNPVHKTITQLRRVLGDNATAPAYIETIRKRGYRALAALNFEQPATGNPSVWHDNSPFRGLQAFDEEHADVFFGRTEATRKLMDAVTTQVQAGFALQMLLGPSGSGKTSLIRAGLFPALSMTRTRDGLALIATTIFDLGELGEHSLFTALAGAMLDWQWQDLPIFPGASAVSLGLRLENAMDTVLSEMQARLETLDASRQYLRFGLFIDRFEAMFNFGRISEQERRAFLHALDQLARSDSVLAVIGCRNDFYPHVAEYPMLMEGKPRGGHFDLSPPGYADIAQIIRLPALAAGLSFGVDPQSQARLDDVLCESAAASPDALPLLQYSLQELYRLRTADGELSFAAFHQLGGVEGAIGQRAEQVVASFSDAQRAALPHVMSLVVLLSANEESVTSQRAPWSALHHEDERQVVNALIESRLFVSDLVGGVAGFGVAHEAILRRWPRMTDWVETHRGALRIRGRLAQLAARWANEGRTHDLLLPNGKQLDEARSLLQLSMFSLSADELELIRISGNRARRRDRLRVLAMSMIVLLAVLATALGISALGAKRAAEQRRTEAEGLMGFMLGDFVDKLRPIGKLDLLDSVSAKALEYLSRSDGEALNAASLTQRAKALQLIGEVDIERGNSKVATGALLSARGILQQQLAISPEGREVLKNLGANAFWLGRIRMEQGDPDQAAQYFRQYQDHSDRLHALEPENVDWWIEQSYAHSSLGSLALKRGDARSAGVEFLLSIDLKTKARIRKPQDRGLAADLADSLSWLGSAKETLGELDAAMTLYRRETDIVESLHQIAPSDALWSDRLALALQHQALVKLALGQDRAALDDFRIAQDLRKAALQQEPSNRAWQRSFLYARLYSMRIMARQTNAQSVLPQIQDIGKTALSLTLRDPQQMESSRLAALVQQRMAVALLDLDQGQEARWQLAESRRRLEASLMRNPSDMPSRLALADGWLILAETEARAKDKTASHYACQQARALLAKDAPRSTDYRLLDPWARAHACLGNDAIVADVRARLAQIGYREPDYIRYFSNHE